MSEDQTNTTNSLEQSAPPAAAWKRFEPLIGTWEMTGHTMDSTVDNISGLTTFEWVQGGYFLKIEGTINFNGFQMGSVEIVAYDPETGTFPSKVFSSMSGDIYEYSWDVKGQTVYHYFTDSTYQGTFSADGRTLSGGWRANEGGPVTEISANYDAVMTKISQ